jgi:splicing factor 3A subunit 2
MKARLTTDLSRDPYMVASAKGGFECKLCRTLHPTESAYLVHTGSVKHQESLRQRVKETSVHEPVAKVRRFQDFESIGIPAYSSAPILTDDGKVGLLVRFVVPACVRQPSFRIVSSFEQQVEEPNKENQYLVVHSEPYEVIGFLIPNRKISSKDSWWIDGIFYVKVIYEVNKQPETMQIYA